MSRSRRFPTLPRIDALSERDLRAALTRPRVWLEQTNGDDLVRLALRDLRELIPCETVGWNEIDLARGSAELVTDPEEVTEVPIERFGELVVGHPLVEHVARTGDLGVRTISDVVSSRTLHRLPFYEAFLQPLGVEEQLATIISGPPLVVGIAFNRKRKDFTPRDRALLELLRPYLSAAHTRAQALDRLSAAERGLEARHAGVAIVGPAGELDRLLGAAETLLVRHFGAPPLRVAPGTYARADAMLHVREVAGMPPLLLLHEQRLDADPERARKLGLTTRESEILGLARRGCSNPEIARLLVISPRTVQKHLENAYDKLGTRDRHGAAAVLFDD